MAKKKLGRRAGGVKPHNETATCYERHRKIIDRWLREHHLVPGTFGVKSLALRAMIEAEGRRQKARAARRRGGNIKVSLGKR